MRHPCRYPCCAALLTKSGYCDKHKHYQAKSNRTYDKLVRAKDPALAEAKRIRSSAKWYKLSRYILASNPICADPYGIHEKQGTTGHATQVDHIKPLRTHPELWNTLDNLQCLCTGCHSKKGQDERRRMKSDPEPSSTQRRASSLDEPPKHSNKWF